MRVRKTVSVDIEFDAINTFNSELTKEVVDYVLSGGGIVMLAEVRVKTREARKACEQLGYVAESVSAEEFFDYLTGEIFSDDKTTLRDVLDSEFLMVHELVEISELKKMGRTINKRVVVESPKTVIYEAHFTAMEIELNYALVKKDYAWARKRLEVHKTSALEDDPNLPEELRPRGEAIHERFKKLLRKTT